MSRPGPFKKKDADKLRHQTDSKLKAGKKLKDLTLDELLVLYADLNIEIGDRDKSGQMIPRGRVQFVRRRLLSED